MGARTAAFAASVLLAPAGFAEQVSYSDSVPLTATGWNDTLTVPKFDPALGVLQSIDVELAAHAQGSTGFENLTASSATISMTYRATGTLKRPNGVLLLTVSPAKSYVDPTGPYDGVLNFGGSSGKTYTGVNADAFGSVNLAATPAETAIFVGAAGNPGTLNLPLSMAADNLCAGAAGLVCQMIQSASAVVTVRYNFTVLDCNMNGVSDGLDLLNGTSQDDNGNGIPDECDCLWSSYCVSTPNSAGSVAMIGKTGSVSIAANDLVLVATGCPANQLGAFIYGSQQTQTPFGNGYKCVGGPQTFRFPPVSTGPLGITGTAVDYGNPPAAGGQIGAGTSWNFQFWYRDPAVGAGFNLSDALHVNFCQ
jgi:hypothetical protein